MDTRTLRHYDDLPGPSGLPIFGNALQIKVPSMHQQLYAWSQAFGPVFKLRLMKRRVIVVADHAMVAGVLRDRPDGYRRTTRLAEMWDEMGLPPGVFGANGETWKRQRRMVMAGFDPAHVKRYFPAMQGVAQRLAGRWHKAASSGATIDLQADLMRYTVDTIAGLAFGAEVNTLESNADVIQQHLDKFFPELFNRIMAPLPTWRWLRTARLRAFDASLVHVKAAVDGFVTQARARMAADASLHEHPRNLLEAMIAAADQPGSGIDDTQVAGNVLTMLLAGEDTTANTLAWMIHLLWRNPAALQRAQAEVRATFAPGEELTMDKLAQLDFVEACMFETMRLKPVAPILPLQTVRDSVIGDVKVPAGHIVISLMRHDSVSAAHLSDAAAFQPERWLVDGTAAAAASSAKRISMPFGAGPRICPGRYLAMLEMKLAMAMLLSQFDIQSVETPDGKEAREQLQLTMTPVGLRMCLATRA